MPKTVSELRAEIIAQLPTSGQGLITAAVLRSVLDDIVNNFQVNTSQINTISGTPGSTTALFGDNTWKVPSGGGGGSGAGVKFTYVSSPASLDAGSFCYCDTTSTAFTVTLPTSPSLGDGVAIRDARGTWGARNLTVDPGSNQIAGVTATLVCDTKDVSFDLVWRGGSVGWDPEFAIEVNRATGGGGGLGPLVHWDPLAKAPSIVLSGGQLTATATLSESGSNVLANQSGSQNRYFEGTSTGGNTGFGLANNSQALVGTYPGNDSTNGFGYFQDGYAQGPGQAGVIGAGGYSSSVKVGILYLPATSQLKLYKDGVLAGTFAAPAAGTGVFPIGHLQNSGDTVIINGGSSPLGFLPVGATSWDGSQSN